MSELEYHGDPAAMRSEAAAARLKAERISDLAGRLVTQAESIDFEGPAANEFRAATSDRARRAEGAAAVLTDTSSLLLSAAAYAEEEIARAAALRRSEAGW